MTGSECWCVYMGSSDGRRRWAGGEEVCAPWRRFVKDMDDVLYDMSDSDDCISKISHQIHRRLALLLR